jgi:hypothetical protein
MSKNETQSWIAAKGVSEDGVIRLLRPPTRQLDLALGGVRLREPGLDLGDDAARFAKWRVTTTWRDWIALPSLLCAARPAQISSAGKCTRSLESSPVSRQSEPDDRIITRIALEKYNRNRRMIKRAWADCLRCRAMLQLTCACHRKFFPPGDAAMWNIEIEYCAQ